MKSNLLSLQQRNAAKLQTCLLSTGSCPQTDHPKSQSGTDQYLIFIKTKVNYEDSRQLQGEPSQASSVTTSNRHRVLPNGKLLRTQNRDNHGIFNALYQCMRPLLAHEGLAHPRSRFTMWASQQRRGVRVYNASASITYNSAIADQGPRSPASVRALSRIPRARVGANLAICTPAVRSGTSGGFLVGLECNLVAWVPIWA
jgi:hypothetical protein